MKVYRLQERDPFKWHPTLLIHPCPVNGRWDSTETVLPHMVEDYQIEKTTAGFDRVTGPEGVIYLGMGPVSVVLSPAPF